MNDHIIKAAREADFSEHDICGIEGPKFAALYAIAYRQGMERAAEICGQIVLDHPGRADLTAMQLERAIRAHVQNQPKNVHDSGVMSKK